MEPTVARKVLARLRSGAVAPVVPPERDAARLSELSAGELDVLRLLGHGASNREIADRLALTEGIVKNYISSILAKTELRDRTQAALLANRCGLVED